jgi:hypothetical protein
MANVLTLTVASGFDPVPLGFISVNKQSQGNALWWPARNRAASASNCDVNDVTVVGLQYGDGHRVLTSEADRQSVAQLALDNPVIIVNLPDAEPPYVKKLKDDLSGVLTWKATAAQQLADLGVVVRRLQRENNQYNKILVRILLDSFREKYLRMYNRTLTDVEKQTWNTTLDNMTDDDLRDLGVTRPQAALSKYGQRTAQDQGGAAHVAGAVPIAFAVIANQKAGFRAIFRSVYNQDADEVVEEAEAAEA